MVKEAQLERVASGLAPVTPGWFVVNTRDAEWLVTDTFGCGTQFESEKHRFPQVGFNITVLEPGEPNCLYHREAMQEDFLVLAGECLLLIEGEERPLKAWDFVHCPKGTEHVFVGAGSGPCAVLAVGSRSGGGVVYPASELAQRHGAGVPEETHKPEEAYAGFQRDTDVAYREGWLPG